MICKGDRVLLVDSEDREDRGTVMWLDSQFRIGVLVDDRPGLLNQSVIRSASQLRKLPLLYTFPDGTPAVLGDVR